MKGKSKKLARNISSQNEFQKDYTTIDLYEFSIEKCDLCDAVFYNKFNIMVHMASHIIIPLLRQNLHQCAKCKNYFPTSESVELHILNDHLIITNKTDYNPELLESFIKKEPYTLLVKEEFALQNNAEDVKVDLVDNFVTMQPVTLLTKEPLVSQKETDSGHSTLQSLVEKQAIILLEPLVTKIDVISVSDDDSSQDSLDSKSSYNNSNKQTIKIKDRILFEDEDTDLEINNSMNDSNMNLEDDEVMRNHELLNRRTTDCRVNINTLNGDGTKDGFRRKAIILGKYPCDNVHSKSVHYDDLVMPGIYRCKKCGKSFSNRYKMIVHEANHIRFERRAPILCRICDWYIGNTLWDLQKHQRSKHPRRVAPTNEIVSTVCRKCGLKYRHYYRHMRNYHNMYICISTGCSMKFMSKVDYYEHRVVHNSTKNVAETDSAVLNSGWNTKTMKVCELCYSFLKNTSNVHYKVVSVLNEIGVRFKCDRCENIFFELKLVKLDVKKRKIRDESERKSKCNKDRLKSLQRRFKKLKLLNKY